MIRLLIHWIDWRELFGLAPKKYVPKLGEIHRVIGTIYDQHGNVLGRYERTIYL